MFDSMFGTRFQSLRVGSSGDRLTIRHHLNSRYCQSQVRHSLMPPTPGA